MRWGFLIISFIFLFLTSFVSATYTPTLLGSGYSPEVSEEIVVWSMPNNTDGTYQMEIYDINNNETTIFPERYWIIGNWKIFENYILYTYMNIGNTTSHYAIYNLETKENKILPELDEFTCNGAPYSDLEENKVYFVSCEINPIYYKGNYIYEYDLNTKEIKKIISKNDRLQGFEVDNQNIFYLYESNQYERDLTLFSIQENKQNKIIKNSGKYLSSPQISEDNLVWIGRRSLNSTDYWQVFNYNLKTEEIKQITNTNFHNILPDIYQNKIVWKSPLGLFFYDLDMGVQTNLVNSPYIYYP